MRFRPRFNLRLVLVAFIFYGLGLATSRWIDQHKLTVELRKLQSHRSAIAETLTQMQDDYAGIFDGRGHKLENPRADKLHILIQERRLAELDRQIEILAEHR